MGEYARGTWTQNTSKLRGYSTWTDNKDNIGDVLIHPGDVDEEDSDYITCTQDRCNKSCNRQDPKFNGQIGETEQEPEFHGDDMENKNSKEIRTNTPNEGIDDDVLYRRRMKSVTELHEELVERKKLEQHNKRMGYNEPLPPISKWTYVKVPPELHIKKSNESSRNHHSDLKEVFQKKRIVDSYGTSRQDPMSQKSKFNDEPNSGKSYVQKEHFDQNLTHGLNHKSQKDEPLYKSRFSKGAKLISEKNVGNSARLHEHRRQIIPADCNRGQMTNHLTSEVDPTINDDYDTIQRRCKTMENEWQQVGGNIQNRTNKTNIATHSSQNRADFRTRTNMKYTENDPRENYGQFQNRSKARANSPQGYRQFHGDLNMTNDDDDSAHKNVHFLYKTTATDNPHPNSEHFHTTMNTANDLPQKQNNFRHRPEMLTDNSPRNCRQFQRRNMTGVRSDFPQNYPEYDQHNRADYDQHNSADYNHMQQNYGHFQRGSKMTDIHSMPLRDLDYLQSNFDSMSIGRTPLEEVESSSLLCHNSNQEDSSCEKCVANLFGQRIKKSQSEDNFKPVPQSVEKLSEEYKIDHSRHCMPRRFWSSPTNIKTKNVCSLFGGLQDVMCDELDMPTLNVPQFIKKHEFQKNEE